jgi:hypothetical protein
MNKVQYESLEKFKEKLLSEKLLANLDQFDDLFLLRYLRARKFDIDKTYFMFSNFLKWREDNQVNYIEVNIKFNLRISISLN